jgi:hypothetical protein
MKSEIIRVRKLTDVDQDDHLKSTTPAERLAMMWQLTLDAWAFKGEPVAELRLPRHIVRVLRTES